MADDPEPQNPIPAPEPPPPAEPPVEAKPPRPTWQEVELGQTRRQLEENRAQMDRMRDENRRLAELAQAAERPPSAAPPPSPPEPRVALPQQPEFRRAVDEEVAQRIRNEKAADLDLALKRDFAEDYQAIVNNFANIQDSIKLMFGDIMATDDPVYVAATIGRDPSHIQQLRDLPAARRMAELIKIAMNKPKPTAVAAQVAVARPSEAPPPPTMAPAGGGPTLPASAVNLYDERFEFNKYYNGDLRLEQERDAVWYEERSRQKRERWLATRQPRP